jgi:nucleoside-diphosphate-sugar epimerase
VLDAVEAYALLGLTKNIEGKVINFGSGKETQIKNLAKLIIKLCNTNGKLTFSKKLRSGETPRLLCNPSLAKKILRWSAKTDLETGLLKTIEYYKERKHLVENLPFML